MQSCSSRPPNRRWSRCCLPRPGVKLADLSQARRLHAAAALSDGAWVLPRGVVDLAKDIPAQDVHLIAPTAELIARARGPIRPVIQLFVQARRRKCTVQPAGFARCRTIFHAPRTPAFPMAPEAARIYRNGPPLLQRYLPFWIANVIDRMWVALGVDHRRADPRWCD